MLAESSPFFEIRYTCMMRTQQQKKGCDFIYVCFFVVVNNDDDDEQQRRQQQNEKGERGRERGGGGGESNIQCKYRSLLLRLYLLYYKTVTHKYAHARTLG